MVIHVPASAEQKSAQQHVLFAEGFGIWLKYSKIEANHVTPQHIDKYVCYRERHQQRTKGTGILTAPKRIVKIIREADTSGKDVIQDNRTPAEKKQLAVKFFQRLPLHPRLKTGKNVIYTMLQEALNPPGLLTTLQFQSSPVGVLSVPGLRFRRQAKAWR